MRPNVYKASHRINSSMSTLSQVRGRGHGYKLTYGVNSCSIEHNKVAYFDGYTLRQGGGLSSQSSRQRVRGLRLSIACPLARAHIGLTASYNLNGAQMTELVVKDAPESRISRWCSVSLSEFFLLYAADSEEARTTWRLESEVSYMPPLMLELSALTSYAVENCTNRTSRVKFVVSHLLGLVRVRCVSLSIYQCNDTWHCCPVINANGLAATPSCHPPKTL